jgi:hypothetical protein
LIAIVVSSVEMSSRPAIPSSNEYTVHRQQNGRL